MLQLLLVFVAMAGTVCGEGCNQFYSRLTNDDSLLPVRNNSFFQSFTEGCDTVRSIKKADAKVFKPWTVIGIQLNKTMLEHKFELKFFP